MNDDTTVDLLNDLLETCSDAESCCRGAAAHAESAELKRALGDAAAGCAQAAAELASLVRQRGGEPESGGSVGGTLQRGWQAVTSTLGGGGDKALLDECEQVLNGTAADYRKALTTRACRRRCGRSSIASSMAHAGGTTRSATCATAGPACSRTAHADVLQEAPIEPVTGSTMPVM
jgi:uncharacterized protein (TIGR02284 family)